jgi:hypothetical protein
MEFYYTPGTADLQQSLATIIVLDVVVCSQPINEGGAYDYCIYGSNASLDHRCASMHACVPAYNKPDEFIMTEVPSQASLFWHTHSHIRDAIPLYIHVCPCIGGFGYSVYSISVFG